MNSKNNAITDIPGIKVGHAHNEQALTGCTVILTENGATAGVDSRGGAPGTRETDALHPMHLVQKVHAIMLAGGSAFGLDAASGAMKFLEERGIGFDVGVAKVPIVPAAILFDLGLGSAKIRPDAAMGYQACQNASAEPPAQGNAGAGMGASVGKILSMKYATKAGIGSACLDVGNGVLVGALIAVNAFGDVIDPETGQIIAGVRSLGLGPIQIGKGKYADSLEIMRSMIGRTALGFSSRSNTVIGVVATNANLTKEETNKVAQMAHNGLARTIRPAHTMMDGDTIFSLSTGQKNVDVSLVGAFAAEAVARAIVNAVRNARQAGGILSAFDD